MMPHERRDMPWIVGIGIALLAWRCCFPGRPSQSGEQAGQVHE
jgi:hypothetical protein